MKDSLSIQNISKSYNDTTVFKLISFNINPGKIYNLSGPNGAGKTTLMKIVASQILDYSGEIFLGKGGDGYVRHYEIDGSDLSIHPLNIFSLETLWWILRYIPISLFS